MAPIPEATFFVTFSIWPLQSSLSSIVTPSDFVVVVVVVVVFLLFFLSIVFVYTKTNR